MLTSLHIQRYQGWQDTFLRDIGAQWGKVVNPDLDTPILPSVPHVLVRFWSDDVAAGYIARGYEGGRAYVRDYAERFRRVQARGKVLELWNEPDNRGFWRGTPEEYLEWAGWARDELATAAPGVPVVKTPVTSWGPAAPWMALVAGICHP